jgi:putative MFS transporter
MTKGKHYEANKIVEKMAMKSKMRVELQQMPKKICEKSTENHWVNGLKLGLPQLWSSRYKKITLSLWFTWFSVLLTQWAIMSWLPTILIGTGVNPGSSFTYNVLIESVGLLSPFILLILVGRLSRKSLTTISLLGYSFLIFVWSFFVGWIPLFVGIGLVARLFLSLSFPSMQVLTLETYHTKVRPSGLGWGRALGRLGGLVGSVALPLMWVAIGLSPILIILALFLFVSGVFVFSFGIETKEKPLED